MNWTLAVVRAVTVFLISFLLLSPLVKSSRRHTEKPVVILAMDNSESLRLGKDSAFHKKELVHSLKALQDKLSGKFEVVTYSFADKVENGIRGDLNGKQTNFGNLFKELQSKYANRNLAALVIASDGIVTQGPDPVYAAEKEPYSIYTVALGDTSQQKDLLVAHVNYNQIAYLGNTFPVEITVAGYNSAGTKSRLTVSSGKKEIVSKEVLIRGNSFMTTIPVTLNADVSGIQRYRISLAGTSGEISYVNNVKEIFVEVIDGRRKILMVSASPHPDIAAFKAAVERNKNYVVEDYVIGDFNGNIDAYDLVILHQVPSLTDAGSLLLTKVKSSKVPVMYILGAQSNLQAFNALQTGLVIPPVTASFSSAYSLLNQNFSQFALNPEVAGMFAEYPPLSVPFGKYTTGTTLDALVYQKIGSVSTTMPLIAFNQGLDSRTAIIAGEGIWRWRLTDYLKTGNHDAFDELISKMIQYLAAHDDKSRFRLRLKNCFNETEPIEMDAEVYNESYELVNEPEVSVTITDQEGKNFPYTFTRTVNAYYLNAGSLPPGDYRYAATVSQGGKRMEKKGSFVVLALNEEMLHTVADFNVLVTLAKQHNGEMVYGREIDKLSSLLTGRPDFKPVIFTRKQFTELSGIFPVFLLITALLTLEWVLRRRNGGY